MIEKKPAVRYRVISTRQFLKLKGKNKSQFKKKPQIGLQLIERSRERGYRPSLVVIDAGYGNNTTFLMELEKRKIKYMGGVATNRKVIIKTSTNHQE